jgi:hypothetical protein
MSIDMGSKIPQQNHRMMCKTRPHSKLLIGHASDNTKLECWFRHMEIHHGALGEPTPTLIPL